jgi:outer membrane protein OmpA-like peptidoglycan-associated protein
MSPEGNFGSNRQTIVVLLSILGMVSLASAHPATAEGILSSDELIERLDSPPPRTRGLVKIKDSRVATTPDAMTDPQAAPASVILNITFAYNSSELSTSSIAQLNELGKALNSQTLGNYSFEIAGHTDASGDAGYNRQLSMQRAEAVRHYLDTQLGVSPQRLQTTGWGEERLIRPENPNHPDNRRVEIINLGYAP